MFGRPLRWVLLILLAVAVACGGDDDAESTPTEDVTAPPPEVATEPAAEDPTPTAVPTRAPTPTTAPAGEPEDEVVNANPVVVDLAEFKITTATTIYKAGTIDFEIRNTSDTPHEFGIARGESYEALPLLEDGSIDEEALGADFLGKTAVVDQVLSPTREITFELEPGPYVFFCNLTGSVSHAALGQVLSVTVIE